ncbi:MAG: RNA polymerase factor sigma-54 [Bacteroidota bacterium]
MLKQNLSQKLLQKLSPQQIQLMKLLQVPTAALEQRIKEEMEANPALEEGHEQEEEQQESDDIFVSDAKKEKDGNDAEDTSSDDMELSDYINDYLDDDTADYKLKSNNYTTDEEDKSIPIPVENTFHEYLEQQLGLINLPEDDVIIALQIIGSIDDDGYLRREPIAIVDDLAFSQNVMTSSDKVVSLLEVIQRLDPAGVGARDLRECLLIQLERKLEGEEQQHDGVKNAATLIRNHFEEFSKKHYEKLQKQMGISEAMLKEAVDEILKLNPKPASGYASGNRIQHYIVPDFIITNDNGDLTLVLNSRNAPELRISDSYKDMLKDFGGSVKGRRRNKKEREAVMFIKQKIDSAKWFIDAIKQRQQTMYKTMYSIMQYQYDFFLSGDQKRLRPMILKDIAEITGLDISTVSRVANSKYVQTEFGTKRLKDFFSESLQTDSGEEVSTLEVKKILTELIEKENKRKPLSDEKLKDELRKAGYNIARRTVAKYREQLNIPVARLRKQL